jgi:hypothetical protein
MLVVMISACGVHTSKPPSSIDLDRLFLLPPAGGEPVHDDFQAQVQGMELSMAGREDRVAWPMHNSDCQPLLRAGSEVQPLAEITRLAAGAQIVIINEAHHEPQGRAFVADVLAALRPLGYTIYAAETFSPKIAEHSKSYPRIGDGTYTNEPTFGDTVRRAHKLGYRLVPYEMQGMGAASRDPKEEISEREEAEANNLVSRIFAKDPRARVVIHVGYSHARKLAQEGLLWMAARLEKKTGVVPLTIDQTEFGPAGDSWHVCTAQANGRPLDPAFDFQIAPPEVRFDHGRPTWRTLRGQRQVPIPIQLRRPAERMLFEAHAASEPDDAVPIDRVLIDPGESLPLLLPSGSYRVRARGAHGPWSPPFSIHVP